MDWKTEYLAIRDRMNAVIASESSGTAPPPVTTTPPQQPVPPTGMNPPPAGVRVGTEWFDWQRTGQMIDTQLNQGEVLAIPFNVPAGYSGSVYHTFVANKGSDFDVKLWTSMWTPGGDPIPGTVYEGSIISGAWDVPGFRAEPGNYFFNALLKNKSVGPNEVGAQQHHNP